MTQSQRRIRTITRRLMKLYQNNGYRTTERAQLVLELERLRGYQSTIEHRYSEISELGRLI